MASRVEALVKPELLRWVREDTGLTIEEAARKVPVKPERLESWERGEARPTVHQLRKLAQAYKRPLAVFYLSVPPKTFEPLHDFRRLPDEANGQASPELRFEVRRAHNRRQVALELYAELGISPPDFAATANRSEDPERLGFQIRDLLGITYQQQVGWEDRYDALKGWRSALESLGLLVFQATDIKVSEMRGFSISDRPLPVIVVNIKDSPRGRIFTMLHELAHILLKEGGLCDLEEGSHHSFHEQQIEVFCNRIAGTTLVPMEYLLAEGIVARKGRSPEWTNEEIKSLADRYNVSREVILRRLLAIGYTTEDFYRMKREEYKSLKIVAKGGFAPPDRMAISTNGYRFIRLVLDSYYQEKITSSDLSDFLGVRLKHMPKIEKEVMGQLVEFGAVA